MNNFSSMAGIVAGLNAAPVDRLKRTKELLSAKSTAMKADLDKIMDSSKNFAHYKETLKTINPPCVPFFGRLRASADRAVLISQASIYPR